MARAAAFGCNSALGFKLAQGRVDRLLRKPGKGAYIAQRASPVLRLERIKYLKSAVGKSEPICKLVVHRVRFADKAVEAAQLF